MSGGRLVVVDRAGRDVKRFPLREGLATLGSDPACDIRVMLPAVRAHHATVVVHANQTVVRSVCEGGGGGETLVNGAAVSVAALRHGDVIELGGRRLRWEYAEPGRHRPLPPQPALQRRGAGERGAGERARAARRGSEPAARHVIVPALRASMPASSSSSTSGKQVAIVQPQRRDTSDQNVADTSARANVKQRVANASKRSRSSKHEVDSEAAEADAQAEAEAEAEAGGESEGERARRRSALADTTQATLWIESRKPSPRTHRTPPHARPPPRAAPRAASAKKSTPLRMAVLKKAQSAHKMRVMKIQAPLKLDSTKQAAIMLMTGYTPKSKQPSPKQAKRPSYVVKKPSPVRKTPKGKRSSGRPTTVTPKVSILEISDSDTRGSKRLSNTSKRSGIKSPLRSPLLPSPKKSSLKDPSVKKSGRKTESIKFDLSNLENNTYNRSSDVFMVTETTQDRSNSEESVTGLTLHYDTSSTRSPSPRKSINSRSSRMLEKSTGTPMTESPTSERSTLIESPRARKSLRGSIILQNALGSSEADVSSYSRRTTKSMSDQSWSNTIASGRQTRTLSPRASQNKLESYSIVDLVSIDSNESGQSGSVYNSAGSVTSSGAYDTPETVAGRRTRSTIDPTLLGSSTPYVAKKSITPDSKVQKTTRAIGSNLTNSRLSTRRTASRNSESMTTPENTEDATKNITFNSTRISRASKSRSRINDSDILLIEGEEEESSPKSSRRISKTGQPSPMVRKNIAINETPSNSPSASEGMATPENRHSPIEASTPVLSIQSLLDASQLSDKSQRSQKKGRKSVTMKRKTIGSLRPDQKKGRIGLKSKSLSFSTGRSLRGRDVSFNLHRRDASYNDEEVVTPKSAVKIVQEAVKNKHSTAKKPQSKRSLIDNLNESDIVKQLFNSPVKRKLSQSMTEFSRKQLFDDDDIPPRPTRATIAVVRGTPENSLLDNSEAYTPDVFVSPLTTPSNSPNLTGIRRLYQKNTPNNDLRNVRGVKGLLRTPRARKSIRNDLSNVTGVKNIFAKSPRNRLSDVRVKEVFAASPQNDLRRVSGVKALFQSQRKVRLPRNGLDDVRGVRTLFQENNPSNDLRNISGVKKTLQRKSPRNDLSDVRGVKQMFRQEKQRDELSDMSGVEELFQDNIDTTFDQLMGRPPIRAYHKSNSFLSKVEKKKKTRKTKSLHDSISLITSNVEEWLENELRKRVHRDDAAGSSTATARKLTPNKSTNSSRTNMTRELQKLTTDTVEGTAPLITARTRNSSMIKSVQSDVSTRKKSASELYSAHTLPIKKRSLVEASFNKSNNDRSNKLPIKKRVVVHSTPVKGRVNMTMNASEIGRMSPIVPEDKTTVVEVMIRPLPQPKKPPRANPPRITKTKPGNSDQTKTVVENVKPSPKKTRSSKAVQSSPLPTRATRGRKTKNDNQEVLNVKKRRSSLVITKKAPVLSPKPASPKATRRRKAVKEVEALQEESNPSPKRTRATKGQSSVESKPTPKKNTRAKSARSSIIVTKPSPKLKPRATRQTKGKGDTQQTEEIATVRKRKTTVSEPEPKEKIKRKKSEAIKESQVGPARKTRRNNIENQPNKKSEVETTEVPKRSRKAAAQDKSSDKDDVQNKRSRKAADSKIEIPQTKTRGRKVEVQEKVEPRRGRSTKVENTVTETTIKGRGHKTKAEGVSETTQPASKGRKVTKDPVQEPVARTRRTKASEDVVEPVTRGRKRKNTEQDDADVTKAKTAVATKTRGAKGNARQVNNAAVAAEEVKVKRTRKGANNTQEKSATVDVAVGRKTRNAVQKEEEIKSVRGKKATVVVQDVPKEGGRKKKTDVEVSDAKERKRSARMREPPAPPAARAPPAAPRARLPPAVSQKGRGRRR